MRQILQRILYVDDYTVTDDATDWRSQWLQFAAHMPGSRALTGGRDEWDEWIEDAVAAFARHFQLRSRYIADTAQQ